MNTLAFFGMPGWQEVCIIAVLGFLIFGNRIPGIARSLGQSFVEFKRGLTSDTKISEPPVKGIDRS